MVSPRTSLGQSGPPTSSRGAHAAVVSPPSTARPSRICRGRIKRPSCADPDLHLMEAIATRPLTGQPGQRPATRRKELSKPHAAPSALPAFPESTSMASAASIGSVHSLGTPSQASLAFAALGLPYEVLEEVAADQLSDAVMAYRCASAGVRAEQRPLTPADSLLDRWRSSEAGAGPRTAGSSGTPGADSAGAGAAGRRLVMTVHLNLPAVTAR